MKYWNVHIIQIHRMIFFLGTVTLVTALEEMTNESFRRKRKGLKDSTEI